MQEKAIEVALISPDIALIQGPPGTGKTTVIAAILERLNELADKRGASTKGQVLLTGFQHDAVENMIDRLSLNSIPVPKFGKRSGAEEDDSVPLKRALKNGAAHSPLNSANEILRSPKSSRKRKSRTSAAICYECQRARWRRISSGKSHRSASPFLVKMAHDGQRTSRRIFRAKNDSTTNPIRCSTPCASAHFVPNVSPTTGRNGRPTHWMT